MPRFHLQPEKVVSQALAAKADIPEGLRFSYSRVTRSGTTAGREPSLWIFEHPAPEALIVRSGFGPGRIFLSRGALNSSNEATLRALLQVCIDEIERPGLRRRAWSAALLTGFLDLLPAEATWLLNGRSIRGLPFRKSLVVAIAWPWISWLSRLSRRPRAGVAEPQAANAALQGIQRSRQLWPVLPCPGAAGLSVIDPGFRQMVFPAL